MLREQALFSECVELVFLMNLLKELEVLEKERESGRLADRTNSVLRLCVTF